MLQSNLSPEQKNIAIAYLKENEQTAQIAAGANDKAIKEANDNARNEIFSKIMKGGTTDIVQQISNNPSLTVESKDSLLNFAKAHASTDPSVDAMTYGKGHADLYLKVTAPIGDPNKIIDPNIILQHAGPNGDLTPEGAQQLITAINISKKSPEEASVQQAKGFALQALKNRFSYEGQEAGIAYKDSVGAALFNDTIAPNFLSAYDKAVSGGKDPYEFLKKDNLDKLFPDSLRPKSQMAMDKISEGYSQGGETPPQASVPMPDAPKDVNQDNWNSMIGNSPKLANGSYWNKSNWAGAINKLYSDPSPETIKAFDEYFGPSGYKAEDILKQLKSKPDGFFDRAADIAQGLAN